MIINGYFTDYLNNRLLDQMFGGVPYVPPKAVYIGLSQSRANRRGDVAEPFAAGNGYARVKVANDLVSFPPASMVQPQAGTKSNAVPIVFPEATGAWGTVSSIFVADAPTGGNVLCIADLTACRTVDAGDHPLIVAPGALFLSST